MIKAKQKTLLILFCKAAVEASGSNTLVYINSHDNSSLAHEDLFDEKVDKVTGKVLTDINYSSADKAIVDSVADIPTALTDGLFLKVDKVAGKGLSDNNYSDIDKSYVDNIGGFDINTIIGSSDIVWKWYNDTDFVATHNDDFTFTRSESFTIGIASQEYQELERSKTFTFTLINDGYTDLMTYGSRITVYIPISGWLDTYRYSISASIGQEILFEEDNYDFNKNQDYHWWTLHKD